jgi:glycolate oxidase
MSPRLPVEAILTDIDSLERYAHDASEAVAPMPPSAVVRVASTAEVSAVMEAAHAHRVPVTPRAAGTGRVGGAVPMAGGIVLALERMNSIRGIEAGDSLAVVEPGVVTGELHRAVESEGLFYPPDPNSWESCTLGGNIATNAGGPRAFGYGVTRDYVLGLEAVMADGSVMQVGRRTRKGVTGYDLVGLLVGSEGTLGVITEATVRLLPNPARVVTLVALVASEADIAPSLAALRARGIRPRCAELLDAHTLGLVRLKVGFAIPESARALLLIELDAAPDASDRLDAELERAGNALVDAGALEVLVATQSHERERLWAARRELSWALRTLAKNKLSEDVVVPVTELGALLEFCTATAERTKIRMPAYGHAGDGNVHVNFLWDTEDERPRVEEAIEALFERVIALRGTLSGEHGIGVLKAPYLGLEQSDAVVALEKRIKDAWDPAGILNPGKIFPGEATRALHNFHGAC